MTPGQDQDADASKTEGNDDQPTPGAHGKNPGKGEQQDAPTTGARPIPIPDEKADATS